LQAIGERRRTVGRPRAEKKERVRPRLEELPMGSEDQFLFPGDRVDRRPDGACCDLPPQVIGQQLVHRRCRGGVTEIAMAMDMTGPKLPKPCRIPLARRCHQTEKTEERGNAPPPAPQALV